MIEGLLDPDYIVESVGEVCLPDDVFTNEQLEDWAENNGFVKAE